MNGAYLSTGTTNRYVVLDMATERVVSDVVVLIPTENPLEIVPIMRQLGFVDYANRLSTPYVREGNGR